jgi:ribonuclease P protein component
MKKINIIKKDKEISNIIKTGKYKKNNYYVVYKKNNDSNKYYRFCVCVSKKIGNAVVRNKNKRQIKDIIDKSKIKFSRTSDYVIIIKKEINSLNYEEKKNNLIDLLLKLEGENNDK